MQTIVPNQYKTHFYNYHQKNFMGNVCLCQQTNTADHPQHNFLQSSQAPRSKFHTIASASDIKKLKKDEAEKKSQIKQSAVHVRASSIHKSSNHPSLIRSNEINHKLIVDPPSQYNLQLFRNLQNMSQAPSDFFNNQNMSVYFRDSKTQKSRISKKFSSKDGPKISIQSKHSREDDFEIFLSTKNLQNTQEKDKNIMPSLVKEQNIRVSRSELKQKGKIVFVSEGLKQTTKQMIRSKPDSSLITSTLKNRKDLQTVS